MFATNGNQTWVFSKDLIKCILGLKSCITTYKKGNKKLKKIIFRLCETFDPRAYFINVK